MYYITEITNASTTQPVLVLACTGDYDTAVKLWRQEISEFSSQPNPDNESHPDDYKNEWEEVICDGFYRYTNGSKCYQTVITILPFNMEGLYL